MSDTKRIMIFVVSVAFGGLVWVMLPMLTGHPEPWDEDMLYYLSWLFGAGLICGAIGQQPFLSAIGVFLGQFLAISILRFVQNSAGVDLYAVGILMAAMYSVLTLLGAAVACWFRRRGCR